jgi:hypothetical protein
VNRGFVPQRTATVGSGTIWVTDGGVQRQLEVPHSATTTTRLRQEQEVGPMADDVTITSDELAAVAAKIDADGPLDDRDRTVLRAMFQLAGERVADLAAGDVSGFNLDLDPGGIGAPVSLNFSPVVDITKQVDKPSPSLFLHCCTGKHIPRATITV